MTMSIQRADVIGGGIMGSGIAQVYAVAGLSVLLVDIFAAVLLKAVVGIGSSLVRQLNKARQQRCAVLGSSMHRWRRGVWDARAAMTFIAMTDGRVAQGYQYG